MYVLYEGTSPFGVQENVDNNGNYIGTSMQINLEGKYLEKAKELDQFFIDSFYTKKWSLAKSIPKSNIDLRGNK